VVIAVFLLLVAAGAVLLLPSRGPAVFVSYTMVLCLLLGVVCWLKGERPRWRWGGRE
jgi:hypothetical protein